MPVIDGQLHGDAQRHAARNNRDLVQRIGIRHLGRHQRMPRLVVGGILLFLIGKQQRLTLHAHQDFVLGQLEVVMQNCLAILPGCRQGGFVHHVRQVRARESRSSTSQYGEIDVFGKGNLASMNAQDFLAAAHIRTADHDAPVKSPGTQ